MAGLMDDAKGKFTDMSDDTLNRFNELKSKEQSGELDDESRRELQQLRERFEDKTDM